MAQLSNRDIDLMIRTVAGEAGGEGPEGQAAVAHVIINRLAAGKYGKSASDVVLAPNQFEPWQRNPQGLLSMPVNSPQYKAAWAAVDGVLSGNIPDPTGGATHFFAPVAQRQLGRNPPNWAVEKSLTGKVGGHLFFAPEGKANGVEAIGVATREPQPDNSPNFGSTAPPTLAYAATEKASPMAKAGSPVDELFSDFGIKPSAPVKAGAAAPAAVAPATPVDELMADFGIGSAPKAAPVAVPAGEGSRTGATVAGIVNGIPVVGPYALAGVQKGAAAIRGIARDEKYSDALRAVEGGMAADAAAHPGYRTGGEIAGAVGGYVAGGIPAAGARILGMAGPTVWGRMAAGAASNALIGGADAAVRGQDVAVGGLTGMVGGAGAPVVGGILGGTANALTSSVRNMMPTGIQGVSRPTANFINQGISAEGPAAVQGSLATLGPQGMLVDAGPSLTGLGSAVALQPGAGKTIIENALTGRAAGANDRIGNQLVESLGPARDPLQASELIAQTRRTAGAAYGPVHALAPPVDVSGVVKAIDAKLATATGSQKKALENLRGTLQAPDGTLLSNSETLHNLRQDIDAVLNYGAPGLGVEQGAVARTQGTLKQVRKELDATLKTQVPGMAQADEASALLANRQEAVERGFKEVLGAKAPHPDSFAAARAAAAPGENIAENIGIRGRIDRMFGTGTQRDAVTLNKLLAGGDDGFATENLRTAFGAEPVNKLVATLGREKTFANTTNEVVYNSATARRTAAGKMLDEYTPGSANLLPATLTGVGLQAAKKWLADPLIGMITRTSSEPMRAEIAQVLTMQGQTRDEVLKKLIALQARQNTTSRVGAMLSGGANAAGNRLTLGVTGTMRPDLQ